MPGVAEKESQQRISGVRELRGDITEIILDGGSLTRLSWR